MEKKNALIVDDIPEYTDTIEIYLEDRFHLIKAETFEKAREIIQNTPSLTLAILDIRLEENVPENKDGLKLVKILKETMPETKIIVMSAYQEFDYAVEALNCGADYFMKKPLEPEELEKITESL